MKHLCEQRTDRTAGHDDRTFRAEWTTRADRNRGRERFQHGDFCFHAATTEQNGFESFGNAVAATLRGTVTGRQPNDQAADNRRQNYQRSEVMICRRDKLRRKTLIESKVRKDRDEHDEYFRDDGAERADY